MYATRLSDTPKMLLTHWSRARCALQLSRHVHDHFGVVLEVLHLLLSEHELSLLHGAPTHDVRPRRLDLVQAASDVLHCHDGKVLVACVVRTTRDVCTDAHLELGRSLSCPVPVPPVGNALVFSFARAYPCGWVCSFLSSARVRSPAVGRLFSTRCGSALFTLTC